MHNSIKIEDKFYLCFKSTAFIGTSIIERTSSEIKVDFKNFERLLIKTDLEQYTPLLWKLGLKEVYHKNYNQLQIAPKEFSDQIDVSLAHIEHIAKYQPEKVFYENGLKVIDATSEITKMEELELIELLIFLFIENANGIKSTFKSNKYKKSINSNSPFITSLIIEALIKEYENRKYNLVNLSFEEARDEIENLIDKYWIRNYIERISDIFQPNLYDDIFFVDGYDEPMDLEATEYYMDDNMIEEYAEDHYKQSDVNLELLIEKRDKIKSRIIKTPGAKPKNDHIAKLAERLSYLIRLDRFLSQNNCDDIITFPIKNEDCRQIHNYLAFFQLIEDQRTKTNTTTSPENYIKALIRNYRKYRKQEIDNQNIHLDINSLKQDGELPFF